jgi:predicted transcriptional regulator
MANGPDALEKILGPLEAEVTRTVWRARGPVTVRDLVGRLNESRAEPLAYTTVMTVMSRLVAKGVLSRERRGRGYVYEPVAADAAGIAVRNVVRDFGDAAVAHFVDEVRDNPELMRRLERLLDDRRDA